MKDQYTLTSIDKKILKDNDDLTSNFIFQEI